MRIISLVAALVISTLSATSYAQSLPVGPLLHDGPATPEQLSLVMRVTGSLPDTATATVRYRETGSAAWRDGHALYRIRPSFSTRPSVGSVEDAFAWPIIGLNPGTGYEVEVTVSSGGTTDVHNATFTTRALPAAASAPNKTISAGSSSAQVQSMLNGLSPGDVVQIENGTYNVSNLEINRSGTRDQPIYIRGESRNGVVLNASSGSILRLRDASHLVIENMTLRGAAVDSSWNADSRGVYGGGNDNPTVRNTFRRLTITGVDQGLNFYSGVSEALAYDNTIAGNNIWNAAFLGDNRTWNDDGINMPGYGNVAFDNTISGFGDVFSYAQHVGDDNLTETNGVHYYRNEIRNTLDDLVEVDHAHRNITFYDNRSHNSSTCTSLDPLYGGPFLFARNICINSARVNMHKWNDTNSGQFLYNNTFLSTVTAAGFNPDVAAWYQPNNGPQRAYGFRNNLVVYRGNSNTTLWLESNGHDPVDWTHNSWYPDGAMQWGNVYSSLAQMQQGLGNTTPIFSGTTRRTENDNITSSNPWTTQIVLGANSFTEIRDTFMPALATGTSPKNSGVAIANITDGYSGGAPDRGAVIDGRSLVSYGDKNSTPGSAPKPPTGLRAD